ncbi:MAG TPA: methyltransferase domain-containing protein [Tepidisphaeraceae bacterium]|nr:methyltransferase domain-containing protein [Tepidisphaeraceae bacterium]
MLHYRLHKDPQSSHQQIARLLKDLRPGLTLDVGAAQGFLGRLLRDSNLTIDAIEPQTQWAEHAKPFYRNVYAATVEQAKLPSKAYNAIVCADVLEHLVDPVGMLGQLRRAAADDAAFIISLPNVAHLAVRMMLLAGQFPQMDRGILDRTHLHFYTRDTASDMLHQAGLKIERVFATGVPLDELWRRGEGRSLFNAMMRMQHLLVDLAPGLFAFQWIFLARPA